MTRSVAPSRPSPRTILRSLRMSSPVFLVIAVLFAAAIPVVLLINGKSETTAREAATRFAAALVHNDPGSAPSGGDDDVRRLRTHFGAVTDARVIRVHNKSVNGIDARNRHSFFVAELLLRTARGPAVIELEFPSAPFDDRVDGVQELPPGRASGLSGQQRVKLASAYQKRTGRPTAPPPAVESPVPAHGSPGPRRAAQQLRCVERAEDDAAKLLACVR